MFDVDDINHVCILHNYLNTSITIITSDQPWWYKYLYEDDYLNHNNSRRSHYHTNITTISNNSRYRKAQLSLLYSSYDTFLTMMNTNINRHQLWPLNGKWKVGRYNDVCMMYVCMYDVCMMYV